MHPGTGIECNSEMIKECGLRTLKIYLMPDLAGQKIRRAQHVWHVSILQPHKVQTPGCSVVLSDPKKSGHSEPICGPRFRVPLQSGRVPALQVYSAE